MTFEETILSGKLFQICNIFKLKKFFRTLDLQKEINSLYL